VSVSTEVQARYPSQTLIELTNPRTKGASSIGSTLLDQAITDALGHFETYVQAEYDATIAQHVSLVCMGVICMLQQWGGATGGTARIRFDDWVEKCRAYARTAARGHEGPYSNSVVTPSTPEPSDGEDPLRPEMDDVFFRDLIPKRSEGSTGQAS
jgi:hypothetical protein